MYWFRIRKRALCIWGWLLCGSPPKADGCGRCEGITFVITGKVSVFENRDAFVEYVEAQGGNVSGSVSKNTDYLVNNDVSSKNQKARELGIPIIFEEEFIDKYGRS